VNTIQSGAAGGALQLAEQLQQHLASQVAAAGLGNPALAAGQQLAALDAGGVAADMSGATSVAVHNLDVSA
jgi:hypothetical protein